MRTTDLRVVGDTLILHLHKEERSLNAYTLASALVALANAAKAANRSINPGFEIEVVVEALEDGSFRARIRTIYTSLGNLFSKQNVKTVVLAVIAAWIYEHTLAPQPDQVTISVREDQVVVEHADERVIVPRMVYDEMKKVEDQPEFRTQIGSVFETLELDEQVQALSLDVPDDDIEALPEIRRTQFTDLTAPQHGEDDHRIVDEAADLLIIRAILESSKRRWEFSWRGVRIAAPVLDDSFYEAFTSRRFTIAPGDCLKATLRIYQKRDSVSGIFVNELYTVVAVHGIEPSGAQMEMQ